MFRKNILLGVFGVLGLAVLGTASYLLHRGISAFSSTQKSLRGAERELTGYYARDPFPSPANVARELRNTEMLQKWFAEMMTALAEGQVTSSERSPSIFVGELGRSQSRMEAAAKSNGVDLADDFAFGFDRYFAAGSELPPPDDVPRLTEQLLLVERLCNLLFGAKVARLVGLTREQFEGGSVSRPSPAAPSGLRPMPSSLRPLTAMPAEPSGAPRAGAGVIPDDGMYGRYNFAVEVIATERVLREILNRLASDELFVVVNALWVRKDQADIKRIPQRDDAKEVMYKTDRLVSGPQLETPIQIRLDLDVYKFREVGNRG